MQSEQGLGDTLQFCRYAEILAANGARVVLEAPPALVGLMRTLESKPRLLTRGEDTPEVDFHCPLLSLPMAFRTDMASVPALPRYLESESGKVTRWREMLGDALRLRIGLVWSGNSAHANDRNRSLPLAWLVRHLPAGFDYVSLQKEVLPADEATLRLSPAIRHFGPALEDFTDTAALCDLMDLVICVDTSVAHLGGALGRPTWVLLPFSPDWRWLLERRNSPWYPSLTLYRQPSPGNWEGVLNTMSADLTRFGAA